MAAPDIIFLTFDQALEAIRIDFKQYDPQLLLFSGIMRLVAGEEGALVRNPGRNGAWVRRQNNTRLWLDQTALADYMCNAIEPLKDRPEQLAQAASRVFQANAWTGKDAVAGTEGIFLETGMSGYHCRQCGRCCNTLDYHKEVSEKDVERWRRAQRFDILRFVGITHRKDNTLDYRIWIRPGTNRYLKSCPFLKKIPHKNKWICGIHDIKPDICRQYPLTRKHAAMTGCIGFNKVKSTA
ncbi:MAG: YkgJ family cysteine cluster protein [Desulfobacteraceae bacterium]|nr:YkgJ family cysteine cluster protein [Desulfobacteraceae bacterium]